MKLITPNKKYILSYMKAYDEYKKLEVKDYSFSDAINHDIFEEFKRYKKGKNIPNNHVRQYKYWLIDNKEFVGEISIRLSLTPNLEKIGGNIGYGIRPDKWKNGYGTKMLALGLKKAKLHKLKKVLITCRVTNIASYKIIESNGGILQDIILNNINGEVVKIKRYWIRIKE